MLLDKKKYSVWLLSLASLLCLATSIPSFAQDCRGGDHGPSGQPMERSFHGGHGRWWDKPEFAQKIGLTDDQKKKMDDIFEQHRLRLVDLHAALEKDEIVLHPLLQADQLDEQKILNQIDIIAQDRANLEKAHARMLFDIRKELTPDQWKKVQAIVHEHMMNREHNGWGGEGHRGWHGTDGPNGPPPPNPPADDGNAPQQPPPPGQ